MFGRPAQPFLGQGKDGLHFFQSQANFFSPDDELQPFNIPGGIKAVSAFTATGRMKKTELIVKPQGTRVTLTNLAAFPMVR